MKKITILLCMLFIAVTSFSQTCQITGKIRSTEGEPLEMATILIQELQKSTISTKNGSYEFNNINAGNYTIIVEYLGYETYKQVSSFKSGSNVLNIVLKPQSFLTEDIIVSATRAGEKTPIAYNNISKEDIKRAHNGKDLPFLLSSIPSVVVTSESGIGIGNTSFKIRGTDPTRINVCVNGIPMNDSESQAVFWANVPDIASSVNNIQVQRGVGSSTNGAGAFGGTVNFQTTRINNNAYASIDFAGGSYNTFIKTLKAGTGRIADNFSIDFRYSDLDSDGYIRNAFSDHQSAQMSANYFTENTLIKANIIIGEQHTGISWWGTPSDKLETDRRFNPAGMNIDSEGNVNFYKDQTDNYWQNHYQLILNHSVNNNLKINMALHATTGHGYYEQYKDKEDYFADEDMTFAYYGLENPIINGNEQKDSDFIRRKHMDNIFYGFTSSVMYDTEKLNLIIGGAANKYDGDHFGELLWAEFNTSTFEKNHEWYRNNGTKIDANIFAKANYQINDIVNIYGDVQYRYIDYKMTGLDDDNLSLEQQHYYNFVNPKCGVSLDLSDNSKLYGSFAVGNREPARADLKDASKNEGKIFPKAETMYDYELGYTFNTNKAFFNANLYYMNYKDQLVNTGKVSSNGYKLMTNVDKSYRAGIELSASYQFNDILKWSVNSTISKNIIKDYSEDAKMYDEEWNKIKDENGNTMYKTIDYGNSQISFSPDFIANSLIEIHPYKNLTLVLNSKYIGKQYFDNTQNDDRSIDAYFVNNFTIDYNFKFAGVKSINLQLALNNIFEEEYESNAYGGYDMLGDEQSTWSYYFPQAGFNFMLKASINF